MSRVFVVRAKADGTEEGIALDLGIAIIDYSEVDSLQWATNRKAIRQLVDNPLKPLTNNSDAARANFTRQLHFYRNIMQLGDLVVLPFKTCRPRIGLGRVVGDYRFIKIGAMHRHTRKVDWLRTDISRNDLKRDLQAALNLPPTVYKISSNDAAQRFESILQGGIDPGPPL